LVKKSKGILGVNTLKNLNFVGMDTITLYTPFWFN
jgi:hypothetical protein